MDEITKQILDVVEEEIDNIRLDFKVNCYDDIKEKMYASATLRNFLQCKELLQRSCSPTVHSSTTSEDFE